MQLSSGQRTLSEVICLLLFSVVAALYVSGCKDDTPPVIVPTDDPPQITLFEIINTTMHSGDTATINVGALDDYGIDSAVVDYGEPNNIEFKITPPMRQKHLSAGIQRQFGTVGFFNVTFTVYDTKKQSTKDSLLVMVFPPDTSASANDHYILKH